MISKESLRQFSEVLCCERATARVFEGLVEDFGGAREGQPTSRSEDRLRRGSAAPRQQSCRPGGRQRTRASALLVREPGSPIADSGGSAAFRASCVSARYGVSIPPADAGGSLMARGAEARKRFDTIVEAEVIGTRATIGRRWQGCRQRPQGEIARRRTEGDGPDRSNGWKRNRAAANGRRWTRQWVLPVGHFKIYIEIHFPIAFCDM
jgi:hypothetical protein